MEAPQSFATEQLDRLQEFFPRVEGKASFLFALDIGLLATVAYDFPLSRPCGLLGTLGLLSASLLVFSIVSSFRAFFPHLDGAKVKSVFYFRDIAAGTAEEYAQRLRAITAEELDADLACQIWRNSCILRMKFDRVHTAFWCTGISLIPWGLYLALSAVSAGKFMIPGQS